MAQHTQRLGSNMALASALAILSYVPFELVAKGSLIICAVLFILDPIPPITRLISMISVAVIFWLTRWYRMHQDDIATMTTIIEDQDEQNTGSSKKDN